MILIVGLGNPGKKYKDNRHNLGFMVVRELAKSLGVKFRYSISSEADIARKKYENKDILLALPQTFMNNSGVAVKNLTKRKKILSKNILVVADDIDLNFGRMRIKPKSSDAGHRGIKSIAQTLNTRDFPRVRIGIGHPDPNIDSADYVLSNFNEEEKKQLPFIIDRAVQVCFCWIEDGVDTAMSKFN